MDKSAKAGGAAAESPLKQGKTIAGPGQPADIAGEWLRWRGANGDALMVAVELSTGKVIWKSSNPREWKMTHASVVPMEFGGKKMYVYCGSGGVAGVYR